MSESKPHHPIPLYNKDAHADLTKHCREAMLAAQTGLDISLTYPAGETIMNRTQEQLASSEPSLEDIIAKARARNTNRAAESLIACNDLIDPDWRNRKVVRFYRWRVAIRRLKNAWAALKGAEISNDF